MLVGPVALACFSHSTDSTEVFTVALPIVAEYGFAVGVFQHGWLEWAGIPSTGGTRALLTTRVGSVDTHYRYVQESSILFFGTSCEPCLCH